MESTNANAVMSGPQVIMIIGWILFIFFLGQKPVHLDEANFLAMTKGEFWKPHSIEINWEGRTQSAFDVLSNPPGMAWYLWPVKNVGVFWMRWWIFPLTMMTVWAVWRCIQSLGGSRLHLWMVLCSPLFALSHNSLMPEMPLFFCIAFGWQGILRNQYIVLSSLILGCAGLFRYSGITMIPLLVVWILQHRPFERWKMMLAVCLPSVFLCIHDLWVYGEWHFWHMIEFQQAQQSSFTLVHKGLAFSSMLFLGAGVVPLFDRSIKVILLELVTILILVLSLTVVFSVPMNGLAWIAVPFGMYTILSMIRHCFRSRQYWMLCWLLGGIVFLLNLRFAATRYWLPFVLPYWCLSNPNRWFRFWIGIMGVISAHLVWDDAQLARSQHQLALEVTEVCTEVFGDTHGYFAGHWGWQHAMESFGWESIEDDSKIPNNVCFSDSSISWPQEHSNYCMKDVKNFNKGYTPLLLPIRVHTIEGRANYHSYMISHEPPIPVVSPFGWGYDDWDQAVLRRSCLR